MKPIEALVGEFHEATGVLPIIEEPDAHARRKAIELRLRLISEEYKELTDELLDFYNGKGNLQKAAKEMADLLYVIAGTAHIMEIPLQDVFALVHDSNMSKIPDDGKVVRRADGKILKPSTYFEPDLSFLTEAGVSQ